MQRRQMGSVLMLALALAAAAGIWVERERAANDQRRIERLRAEQKELVELSAENRRLAEGLPPAVTLEAWRADHAAVVRLRGEIERLKSDVGTREQALKRQAVTEPGSLTGK